MPSSSKAQDRLSQRPPSAPVVGAHGPWLNGQLLVAMPGMADQRFARTVIYMCAHSAEGAMGLIINQPAPDVSFSKLLVQLDVIGADEAIRLPPAAGRVDVMRGGPVEEERGYVLHSSDFFIGNSTLPIEGDVCLTATLDILRAIARGEGPRDAILALGSAQWSPGQLDRELQRNGWLTCSAEPELIFRTPAAARYGLALRSIGVDPAMLSAEAGHA